MKKCLVLLEFGSPLGWMQQFIDNVVCLEPLGWDFKLFTSNEYTSKGNFKIVPMNIEEFNLLVKKKLKVKSTMYILPSGKPNFHITDFHVMVGKIFEDYLKEYDFWGIIGNDCVIGRLDHFVPDSLLEDCDIWNDDIGQFNAHFCLFRNTEKINTLFQKIPDWEQAVSQKSCLGCTGEGTHFLHLTDEIGMSNLMKQIPLRWKYPKYYLIHSHDRLENHKPQPKLEIKDDGSLWELLADTDTTHGHRHPFFGREIAYFHFSTSKQWPL